MNNNRLIQFSFVVPLAIISLAICLSSCSPTLAQERKEPMQEATPGEYPNPNRGGRASRGGSKLESAGSPVDGKKSNRKANPKPKKEKTKRTKKKKREDIEFPEDNDLPLLVMDISGGFFVPQAGFTPTPSLRVFADGRVLTGNKSPKVVPTEGQVSVERIESLVKFAVEECNFFEIDTEKVKEEMDATGKEVLVMDAGTTLFEIHLKNRGINTVGVYALPYSAKRFHEIPELSSLVKLQAKCKQIMAEVNLGSPEEAASVVQFANIGLANESDVAPEFTLEHLQYAERFVDGKMTAMFSQTFNSRRHGSQIAVATYTETAEGVPDIVVRVDAN
jgi:hypothetical protein